MLTAINETVGWFRPRHIFHQVEKKTKFNTTLWCNFIDFASSLSCEANNHSMENNTSFMDTHQATTTTKGIVNDSVCMQWIDQTCMRLIFSFSAKFYYYSVQRKTVLARTQTYTHNVCLIFMDVIWLSWRVAFEWTFWMVNLFCLSQILT